MVGRAEGTKECGATAETQGFLFGVTKMWYKHIVDD